MGTDGRTAMTMGQPRGSKDNSTRQESSMIHLDSSPVPAGNNFRLILTFRDIRTDIRCDNSNNYRP